MNNLTFLENLFSLYENLRKKSIYPSISYVKNEENWIFACFRQL